MLIDVLMLGNGSRCVPVRRRQVNVPIPTGPLPIEGASASHPPQLIQHVCAARYEAGLTYAVAHLRFSASASLNAPKASDGGVARRREPVQFPLRIALSISGFATSDLRAILQSIDRRVDIAWSNRRWRTLS